MVTPTQFFSVTMPHHLRATAVAEIGKSGCQSDGSAEFDISDEDSELPSVCRVRARRDYPRTGRVLGPSSTSPSKKQFSNISPLRAVLHQLRVRHRDFDFSLIEIKHRRRGR